MHTYSQIEPMSKLAESINPSMAKLSIGKKSVDAISTENKSV